MNDEQDIVEIPDSFHENNIKSEFLLIWGFLREFQFTPIYISIDLIKVAFGKRHIIALKSNGSLISFGDNEDGKCSIPHGNNFIDVSCGGGHSLALKSDGSLIAWGWNEFNQCYVPDGNEFLAISSGILHNVALKSNGTVIAWGNNDLGQCNSPNGDGFIAIAAGGNHCLALKSDGTIASWGENTYGQCEAPLDKGFIAIAAGRKHSLALRSDGTVEAWGDNFLGQCCAPESGNFVAIRTGNYHNIAIKSDRTYTLWGNMNDQRLAVPEQYDILDVFTGFDYSAVLVAMNEKNEIQGTETDDYEKYDEGDISLSDAFARDDLCDYELQEEWDTSYRNNYYNDLLNSEMESIKNQDYWWDEQLRLQECQENQIRYGYIDETDDDFDIKKLEGRINNAKSIDKLYKQIFPDEIQSRSDDIIKSLDMMYKNLHPDLILSKRLLEIDGWKVGVSMKGNLFILDRDNHTLNETIASVDKLPSTVSVESTDDGILFIYPKKVGK